MGLFDIFKSKDEEDNFDPLSDLSLDALKVGYYLDYDLKTWEVTAYNRYDYGEGTVSDEWELTSGREKVYLIREEDDDVWWSICTKIPLSDIQEDVASSIKRTDDPQKEITVGGETYYLDESGPVHFIENGNFEKVGLVYWCFIDSGDDKYVEIEQWGEERFEASKGFYVKEYQFTNILPGGEEGLGK
ncbi:MAG: DUF4178 domain-containing protein [Calditrichia bacterium]